MEDPEGRFLTASTKSPPVEAGLLERFLEAAQGVEWRPAEPLPGDTKSPRARSSRTSARPRSRTGARLAYFHDETARIERQSKGSKLVLTVTSGPVGALVLIVECTHRGLPTTLESRNAGELAAFPQGAIEAHWDPKARERRLALPFADVVKLARYALA